MALPVKTAGVVGKVTATNEHTMRYVSETRSACTINQPLPGLRDHEPSAGAHPQRVAAQTPERENEIRAVSVRQGENLHEAQLPAGSGGKA